MTKRVDANQKEIVTALRAVGASVSLTHTLGRGFPDLVVGFRGINYLMEIKDGSKPESKRKLTPDETLWHAAWAGQIAIIKNIQEALKLIGAI